MKAITPSFIWDPHEQLEPRSTKSLIQAGVGAILNCIAAYSLPPSPPHNIAIALFWYRVSVRDHAGADILTYLPEATSFLDTHLRRGTSVLVHCEMGVSRSATVCIAYLMQYHNRTWIRPTFTPSSGGRVLIRTKDLATNPCYGKYRVANGTTTTSPTTTTTTTTPVRREPVDRDWAEQSSTLYSTCREIVMEGHDADLSTPV
jgi:hypothetical protein